VEIGGEAGKFLGKELFPACLKNIKTRGV